MRYLAEIEEHKSEMLAVLGGWTAEIIFKLSLTTEWWNAGRFSVHRNEESISLALVSGSNLFHILKHNWLRQCYKRTIWKLDILVRTKFS